MEEEKYLLERIQKSDKTFDEEVWRDCYTGLQQSLSPSNAPVLLQGLLSLARLTKEEESTRTTFPALSAVVDCLEGLLAVQEYLRNLPANDPFISQLVDDLALGRYLASEMLVEDLDLVMEPNAPSEAILDSGINKRLLILSSLHSLSPAFSTPESLVAFGLPKSQEQRLLSFFQARRQGLPKEGGSGLVTSALEDLETLLNLQAKLRVCNEKVSKRNYQEFKKALSDLFEAHRRAYLTKKEDLLSREVKIQESTNHKAQLEQERKELEEREKQLPEGREGKKAREALAKEKKQLEVRELRVKNDLSLMVQLEHQKEVLTALESLFDAYFRSLTFFAEKGLYQGIRSVDKLLPIHSQMVQICASSVALIFIGLIKTGKSTIVDTLIGDHLSPSRTEPMTAIPVRYVHDPSAVEPTMAVPFFLSLNKVINRIKHLVDQKGVAEINKNLKVHLQALVTKIQMGLQIRSIYRGYPEILEASIEIHDLFRLALQPCFPNDLAKDLPLDWSQGLDTFLTVHLKLPNSDHISEHVRLSIIDTPGVNESGVKKLDLTKVIKDCVGVCHYVAFTVTPTQNDAKDNDDLKKLVQEITFKTRTPTLVLGTNNDALVKSPKELPTRQNISLGLRVGEDHYELNDVYLVSGKRKLMGDKMKAYLEKHRKKPELDDKDPRVAALAEEFALFAGFGDSDEEKLNYYEELEFSALEGRVDKLIDLSNMQTPMERMMGTAVSSAGHLSSNKAIETARKGTSEVLRFLRRLVETSHASKTEAELLAKTCEEVFQKISQGVITVRMHLQSSLSDFNSRLRLDICQELEKFLTNQNFGQGEAKDWDFPSKEEAEQKLSETMKSANQDFQVALYPVLDLKQRELKDLARKLQEEVTKHIYNELQRIFDNVRANVEDITPQLPAFPENLLDSSSLGFASHVISSQEKSTSLRKTFKNLFQGKIETKETVYSIHFETVKDETERVLKENTDLLIENAIQKVLKSMNRTLDSLFLHALRLVGQAKEALNEKENLKNDSVVLSSLYNDLEEASRNLMLMERKVNTIGKEEKKE